MPNATDQARMPIKFASAIATTGLATKLSSKFFRISTRLPGGCKSACAAISRNSVLGNKMLDTTALSAARNIPTAYISIIGLMAALDWPTLKFAIEANTKMKTRIGATDFKALINRSPNRLNEGVASGNTTATPTPKIMAMMIRETKLMRIRAENIRLPCENYEG